MNRFLTKNAPVAPLVANKKLTGKAVAMMKFMPATEAELKALGESLPEGYVAGWASTPDLDSYHHIVESGAFDASIAERGLIGPKSIKLLIGHDWDKVAGIIKVLETRNERLWIEAQLNLNISYARDAYEVCKMSPLNFSVGFMLQDYSWKEDDDGNYEALIISRGDLFEVSIVPFPGNEEATMDFVKSKEGALERAATSSVATVAEFEKALVAKGLAKSRNEARRITQEVKAAAHLFGSVQLDAPVNEPEPVIEPVIEPVVEMQKPVIDAMKVKHLSDLVAEMKKLIAS